MLVLNATYEPINVCTVRRAVVLLLKEKAEVVERARWELHSEHTTLPRPVVIRLVTYVRVPRDTHRRKITRRAVFARDGWTCQYCGARSSLTVDHVIPRSKGGDSSWENIVASCAPCNRRKGDRLPHQVDMHPRAKPRTPQPAHLHPRRRADDPGGLAAVAARGGVGAWPPPNGGHRGAGPDAFRRTASGEPVAKHDIGAKTPVHRWLPAIRAALDAPPSGSPRAIAWTNEGRPGGALRVHPTGLA